MNAELTNKLVDMLEEWVAVINVGQLRQDATEHFACGHLEPASTMKRG